VLHDALGSRHRQVLGSEFRWQNLDQDLVLNPDFHHVEAASQAFVALPAFSGGDGSDLFLGRGHADRKMVSDVSGLPPRLRSEGDASGSVGLERRTGGVDLDAGTMRVALQRPVAAWIRRKRHGGAANQFGQNGGDVAWLSDSDGKMVDQGRLPPYMTIRCNADRNVWNVLESREGANRPKRS